MKINLLAGVLGVIFTVVGCGGEGSRRSAGTRCPVEYNPVPMSVSNPSQKLNAKANAFDKLPEGTYKYTGAELYYRDAATGSQILLVDTRVTKDKEDFTPKISCVRNYKILQNKEGLTVEAYGVSDFTIDANHATSSFEVKDFSFKIEKGNRVDSFGKAQNKPGSFKDVYDNVAEEAFLIDVGGGNYQIRSHYAATKKRGDIFLLISVVYSKPSPVSHGP